MASATAEEEARELALIITKPTYMLPTVNTRAAAQVARALLAALEREKRLVARIAQIGPHLPDCDYIVTSGLIVCDCANRKDAE